MAYIVNIMWFGTCPWWTDNLAHRKQSQKDGSISYLVAKAALNLGTLPMVSALTEACWDFCGVKKIKWSCIVNSTLMFVLQIGEHSEFFTLQLFVNSHHLSILLPPAE